MSRKRWDEAVALHQQAVEDLLRAGGSVPTSEWFSERTAGKWSPAQVLAHLTLTYEAVLRELSGGPGMRYRVSGWLRLVLRWTVMQRILRGAPFPRARAPVETRPPGESLSGREQALESFRSRSREFETEIRKARENRPRTRLHHAYFGRISLRDVLGIVARHINHHRKQLENISPV